MKPKVKVHGFGSTFNHHYAGHPEEMKNKKG